MGDPYSQDGKNLKSNMQTINRCFYSATLEEIVENLKRENSAFAKKCLDQISRNSEISMKLAIKMVRQARNLDYKGCLANEINVGLNKIQDTDFELGVSKVVMKPGKHGESPQFRRNIKDDEINSYFEKNKFTEAVHIDVVEKAMLPTRFFYKDYTDQIRLWINEESTPQREVRETFSQELKDALRKEGIDIRDRALTIESARDALYQRFQVERAQQIQEERQNAFFADEVLQERYIAQTADEVQKLKDSPSLFYDTVNKKIQEVFEKAYIVKLNSIFEKSKEVHNLEKRKMLIRFKQFLFQSRIMTYQNEEFERTMKQLSTLPFKQIHLSEKWDETYLKQEHPELNRSILYHLSKAVSKTTIAPVEIAKQYLSNPDLAKSLTHYTFDLNELKALRKDVLENTEKYQTILQASWDSSYFKYQDSFQIKEIKAEEWEYWYRVLNDGRSGFDDLKDYQTLLAYKEFVEGIEKRSVDTLKLVVQRLINDFEAQDGVNEIVEFDKSKQETKREALERLLYLMNGQKEYKKTKSKKRLSKVNNQLLAESRPVSEIKRHVNNLLLEDEHLKHLIPQENENKNNLIHNMKKSLLDDLYQTLELVLLNDDKVYQLPKQVLEERLALILSPKNREDYKKNRTVTSLQVLDQYLADVNAEQTIKAAIQVIKPYYYMQVAEKIEEEAFKILAAFKTQKLAGNYLYYHFLKTMSPEVFTNEFTTKLATFHGERERNKYIDIAFPEFSTNFQLKKMLSDMGDFKQDSSMTLSQKIDQLEVQTKQELQQKRDFDSELKKQEESFMNDIKAYRDEEMTEAYYPELETHRVDSKVDPQAVPEAFDIREISQGAFDVKKLEFAQSYINANGFEVAEQMNTSEWVKIVSSLFDHHKFIPERMFRYGYEGDEFDERNFVQEMKDVFGGKEDLTFTQVAEYATFIDKIFNQQALSFSEPSAMENASSVYQLIMRQSQGIDEISKGSLFQEALEKTTQIKIRDYQNLKQEVRDFAEIRNKVEESRQLRQSIVSLVSTLPQNQRSQVESILDSDSKYLNLKEILTTLQEGKTINYNKIIDNTRLLNDLSKGKLVEQFLKDYEKMALDVVSITQARETIKSAQQAQHAIVNKKIDTKLYGNITLVLDFIQNSLLQVPHERRKSLTLGEYLKRHSFLNSSQGRFTELADIILKNKIEQALGRAVDLEKAETIDWDISGIPSNPVVHEIKNKRVLENYEKGKGYNEEKAIEDGLYKNSMDYRKTFATSVDGVQSVDSENGGIKITVDSQYYIEELLRDARQYTEIKPDFKFLRNQCENEILQAYTSPEFQPQVVEDIIKKYTHFRIQEALLQDGFRQKLAGNDGHLYMKILREEIAKELNISQKTEIKDFLFEKVNPEYTNLNLDMEGRYNTDTLINTEAVGFDNFAKRAANPEQNRNLAHETIFDKLLSEYFVNKRASIHNVNQLIDKMNTQYTDFSYPEGHPHYTAPKNDINISAFPFVSEGQIPLAYSNLKQQVGKDEFRTIGRSDFNEMLELDIAASQALQNNKNGLSVNLRKDLQKELLHVPDYYERLDVRKPPAKVVDDKLTEILSEVFEIRKKLEKTFSRNELLAYDRILAKHLTSETLIPKLERELSKDFDIMTQINQLNEIENEGKEENLTYQFRKDDNRQVEQNKSIKNEDALYKFLAFSGVLEQKRRKDLDNTRMEGTIPFSPHAFEEYVKQELLEDYKKPARPINEADYQPTLERTIPLDKTAEGFMTTPQREEAYFADYEKFKDNKKETQDRNKLFFVLDQFFNKTVAQKEPLTQAQESIMEYFKDTENTYFFDRNKIQ